MREDLKKELINIVNIIRDRKLTDLAGGNMSVRDGDVICITPKYAGYNLHWELRPEHLLVTTPEGEILDGCREMSREGELHLSLYREFPRAGAVIHAHPYWTNVFAAWDKNIVPTLEYTVIYGIIECIEHTTACTAELARKVVEHFKHKQSRWPETAMEVLIPAHGVVAMGRDLNDSLAILDAVETEARCQIMGGLLKLINKGM